MNTRRPRLKWHMLRRRSGDPGHLRANLSEGLKRGAALEVDIGLSADHEFVCLHDATLDRETTGSGPVSEARRADIEKLRLRDGSGGALADPPMFLDEIVAAVARDGSARPRSIQLDIKTPTEAFAAPDVARLRACLGDWVPAFVVGSYDWTLIGRFGDEMPEIARGFDPLKLHASDPPGSSGEFRMLAEAARRLVPDAAIYYLFADLVFDGLDCGVDLVGLFRANGAEVDVWTIDADRPNLRNDLKRLVATGCDQITTNDPERLGSVLSEIM